MTYSEQLEREAEQTRAAFERTLEELRARITPGQIVDQLMDYARTGTAADFFRNLGQRTVDNPLPLMMVGAGIAWLVLANSGRAAGPSAGTIAETTRSAASRVGETARSAGATIGDLAQRARSQIGTASEPQLGQTEAHRTGLVNFFSDHPVALVGLGLAIGAAIGAAVTPTMGGRRDEAEAKERVGHMGEAMHAGSGYREEAMAKERVGHMGEAMATGRRSRGDGSTGSYPAGTPAL